RRLAAAPHRGGRRPRPPRQPRRRARRGPLRRERAPAGDRDLRHRRIRHGLSRHRRGLLGARRRWRADAADAAAPLTSGSAPAKNRLDSRRRSWTHTGGRRMRSMLLGAALAVTLASPAAASFTSCVAGLKQEAAQQGVSRAILDRALDISAPDEKVLRLSTVQPEFKTPIWDYLAFLVDEERIAQGRAMMRRYDNTLRAAERQFGVDRFGIAAVWGVETDCGQEAGSYFLPHALATLTCASNRRTSFWKGELMAALKLVQRGDLSLDKLHGPG